MRSHLSDCHIQRKFPIKRKLMFPSRSECTVASEGSIILRMCQKGRFMADKQCYCVIIPPNFQLSHDSYKKNKNE